MAEDILFRLAIEAQTETLRRTEQRISEFANETQKQLDAIKFTTLLTGFKSAIDLASQAIDVIRGLASSIVEYSERADAMSALQRRMVGTIDDAARASGGFIDQLSLMQAKVRLVNRDIGVTEQQFVALARAAAGAANEGFGTARENLERLTDAIITAAPEALKDFGIRIDRSTMQLEAFGRKGQVAQEMISKLTERFGTRDVEADSLADALTVIGNLWRDFNTQVALTIEANPQIIAGLRGLLNAVQLLVGFLLELVGAGSAWLNIQASLLRGLAIVQAVVPGAGGFAMTRLLWAQAKQLEEKVAQLHQQQLQARAALPRATAPAGEAAAERAPRTRRRGARGGIAAGEAPMLGPELGPEMPTLPEFFAFSEREMEQTRRTIQIIDAQTEALRLWGLSAEDVRIASEKLTEVWTLRLQPAVAGLGTTFLEVVDAAIRGHRAVTDALLGGIGEIIRGIAVQLMAEAVKHGALAFASLFYNPVAAASHAASAAKFAAGAMAVQAMASLITPRGAAAAAPAGAGMPAGAAARGGFAPAAGPGFVGFGAGGGGPINVTVNIGAGAILGRPEDVGAAVAAALAAATRAGRVRSVVVAGGQVVKV